MAKKKSAPKKVKPKKVAKKATKGKAAGKAGKARKKRQPATRGTCFVMMPFQDPFNLYYKDVFEPAIRAANLDPVRTLDLFRPSVIVDDIWRMVRDAAVLLAELTTKNANVFYELGLAHAIGKPVVMVAETMDDVPFDLQSLRMLIYDQRDPTWGLKLRKAITTALDETLADPVTSVPGTFRKKVKSQAPEEEGVLSRLDRLEREVGRINGVPGRSKLTTYSRMARGSTRVGMMRQVSGTDGRDVLRAVPMGVVG